MMTDTKFNELVSAAIDGALTEAQTAALNAELARSPVRREDYLRQTWTSLLLETGAPSAHLRPVRRPVSRKWFAVAACLLLFLGVAFAAAVAVRTFSVAAGPETSTVPAVPPASGSDRVVGIVAVAETAAATVRTADVGLTGAGLSTVYVATNGDDSAVGTVDAPFLTISNAITQLGVDGGTVIVEPGTYPISKELTVTGAVHVCGRTGHPQEVVVTNTASPAWNIDCRVFNLNHARAFVSGLTISGGRTSDSSAGGNVQILDAGGTVSNCIITCGAARGNSIAPGIYLNGRDGLVTHCVVTSNSGIEPPPWAGNSGNAVYILQGRVENCLIAHNTTSTTSGDRSASVYVKNGSLVNCTIITNLANFCGGVLIGSAKGGVTNCVVAGNVARTWSATNGSYNVYASFGSSNVFINCAADTTVPLNDTCVIGTAATFFRDFANGDFTPNESADRGASLYDAGADVGWTGSDTDLVGKSRVVGKRIDIGCYECQKGPVGGFVIRIL